MTPLFPISKPSTLSPVENLKALGPLCHVVEAKGQYALVHASPAGVLAITELGLEVYHSKRGGEYYAVKVGPLEITEPKPQRVVQPPVPNRSAGSSLQIRGQEYRVLETRPKRAKDLRRFEIRKESDPNGQPYVVSFQAHDAACSCPDWIYRRKECKHIRGIQEAISAPQKIAA